MLWRHAVSVHGAAATFHTDPIAAQQCMTKASTTPSPLSLLGRADEVIE
jgi:hypothetical protein